MHVLLELAFFSEVTFRAYYYMFMFIRLHGSGIEILGGQKRDRTDTITYF